MSGLLRLRRRLLGLAALLAIPASAALAQPCLEPACASAFPSDAGALNVRDFGAKGDGSTDDTAALIAALAASGGDTGRAIWHDRIVFLPAGTYKVSGTILKRYATGGFASGTLLVGESPTRTVIRLADHARGFDNPRAPRAVVMTTSKMIDGPSGRDYAGKGEGNDAYENFVENLTIDVGEGNPGAIGLDYLANNLGAVRNVVIRAPQGSGATGIAMIRKWPGPALLQRVSVEGFDIGIDVANTEYGVTLSQIRLRSQRVAGLRNADNMVTAEDLGIEAGSGTSLLNRTAKGMVMLAGGTIGSARSDAPAIVNEGTIVLDGTRVPPMAGISANGPANGWLEGTNWHPQTPGWSLPRPFAPLPVANAPASWVGVSGVANDAAPVDSTEALRAAFRQGPVVYLRHGTFWISSPIEVPASVRRLVGMNSTLRVLPQARGSFPRQQGMLRVLQDGADLSIEHLAFDNTDGGDQVGVEQSASRSVVFRDVMSAGVLMLDRKPGGGAAFLEDVCCGTLRVAGPAPVVARQLNTEGSGVRVQNHGAPLVILGIKTEGNCTVVNSTAGARTVLLGGLLYMVAIPKPEALPAFTVDNAEVIARFVEESFRPASHYTAYLAGPAHMTPVSADTMPQRGLGRMVPLLSSRDAPR